MTKKKIISNPKTGSLIDVRYERITMDEFSPRQYDAKVIQIGNNSRFIFVLENVIPRAAAEKNFEYLKNIDYYLNNADQSAKAEIRHLMHTFPKSQWSDEILRYLRDFSATFLRQRGLRVKSVRRVEAHMNLFGDYQLSHNDGNWWTSLLFANKKWEPDWGGELLFYCDSLDEPAISILPKPGRLVIFDGLIQHRGGVPSKLFLGPRISLVTKFSR